MGKSPHAGGRGVSILGALVIALMLGAGTVATFELATPSLSVVSENSQIALAERPDGVMVYPPKLAPTNQEQIAKNTKAEEDRKKAIEQKCKEAKASLAKEKVGATTKHTPKTFDNRVDPVEPSRCVGAIKKSETEVKCVGLSSEIKLLSNGQVRVTSKPEESKEAGKCAAKYCSYELNSEKKAEEKCKESSIDGYKPIKKQARADSLQELGSNAKNNLINNAPIDSAEGKILADALRPEQEKAANEYEKAKVETQGARDAYTEIKCVAGDTACKDLKDTAKTEVEAAEKREAEARKRYEDLSKQIKRLESGAMPSDKKDGTKDDTVTCKGNVCTDSKGNPVVPPGPVTPGPAPSNNTFPQDQNQRGGLPQDLQKLLGGQPPTGNQNPQAPGTCSAGQTRCSGNTLYSRNNQCVDTPIQYCQYGCAQASGGSGFLSFFGGSGSSQCAPSPQQNQNCQPAPGQPDPSGCQNGSWRPTYTGACVTGWQCVPTGGTGGTTPITALLTCQPQIVDVGMNVSITYSCSSGTSEGGGFETGGALTGSTTVTISNPPVGTNVATFGLKCTGTGTTATKQCSVQIGKPGIVLIANPKNVKDDQQTQIGWVTSGMKSCVISSDDLPQFTAENANKTNVNGTVRTPPLDAVNGSSTSYDFLLHCITVGGNTKEATLSVTATI